MRHKLTFIFIFFAILVSAQDFRTAAILDISNINEESNSSRIASVEHVFHVSGLPFYKTENIDSALLFPVVIIPPRIFDTTFTNAERAKLITYVDDGGVLITSSLRDPQLFPIFGVNNPNNDNTRFRMTWDTTAMPDIFDRIDDSLEVEVSLGRLTEPNTFYSRSYDLNGGISLATYEDGTNAFVYNNYGSGHAYVFGIDLRDVIIRNLIDADFLAHRSYSNGFEPTTDTYIFVISNIIRKHIPHSVQWHTSPGDSRATLMVTHDVDATTGYDTMGYYADSEFTRNIRSSYYLTTKYFSDYIAGPFYLGRGNQVEHLINKNHVIGSHSVGHFPDFSDETLFPFGEMSITAADYSPHYDGTSTSNGSILGEVKVSKDLIEANHNYTVETFRAGYLEYPDSLPLALDTCGYKYNTNHSANNVLTNFPFYTINEQVFSGRTTNVLEIPMTISDAAYTFPIDANNYPNHVNRWTKVTRRNSKNFAPTVLLIHPNRLFKLQAQEDYLDSVANENLEIRPLSEYGAFWKERLYTRLSSEENNNELLVTIHTTTPDQDLSIVIDKADDLDTIAFQNENNQPLIYHSIPWYNNSRLYLFDGFSSIQDQQIELSGKIYPNPGSNHITLQFDHLPADTYQLSFFDITGKKVSNATLFHNGGALTKKLNINSLPEGLYIVQFQSNQLRWNKKWVKQ